MIHRKKVCREVMDYLNDPKSKNWPEHTPDYVMAFRYSCGCLWAIPDDAGEPDVELCFRHEVVQIASEAKR